MSYIVFVVMQALLLALFYLNHKYRQREHRCIVVHRYGEPISVQLSLPNNLQLTRAEVATVLIEAARRAETGHSAH